jgi:arylsulfatase A
MTLFASEEGIMKKIGILHFLKAAGLGLTAVLALSAKADDPRPAAKTNIILILADDLGYECIGANGGTSYKTPVLDDLAKTGMRFEHCYSQPLCTPSRVKLMTGIYNVRNYTTFGTLDRGQTTFANLLKQHGYATCIAGKWQLGDSPDAPQHFGFDEALLWQHTRSGRKTINGKQYDKRYENPCLEKNGVALDYQQGEYAPDLMVDAICDFIRQEKDQPFLVYYPMILTHCPFVPAPDSMDWDPESMGSPTYKGDAAYFGDMVSYMDRLVGRIVNEVDRLGIRDNTLILFTGDNGTDKPVVSELNGRSIAGGKGLMTDAGTRVPLIANWPDTISKGKISSDLVDFSDFFPTLCEVADITVPPALKIDGRSFLPQLKGQKGEPREWIYCWYSRDGKTKVKEWARNQQYKLYRTGEFYDVSSDVLEEKPLNDLPPEAQQVRTTLQQVLDQYKDARPADLAALKKGKK